MTKIMGILNITPNSFSDGGDFFYIEDSIIQIEKIKEKGADIIDIGAESTAPENKSITEQEEWRRLEPLLSFVFNKSKKPIFPREKISLDSKKASTWEKFLALGGQILNDVSGLKNDEKKKLALLKKYPKSKVIIMFSRDISLSDPKDIIKEIIEFFIERINLLESHGIEKRRIIIDPGMGGFLSKNPDISYQVLRKLSLLKKLECELLIGTSRKSFLQTVSHTTNPKERIVASLITALYASDQGATILRVHDVAETKEGLMTKDLLR